MAAVRSSGIFHGDVQAIPGTLILRIGRDECNGLAAGGSYAEAISALMKGKAKPTAHAAAILVDSAIRKLCPRYSYVIPAGAP